MQCMLTMSFYNTKTSIFVMEDDFQKKKNTVRFKQVKNLYISIIGYKFGVRCPKKRGVQIKQVFKWYKTVIDKTGLKKSVRFSEVSGLSRCPVLRFLCILIFR